MQIEHQLMPESSRDTDDIRAEIDLRDQADQPWRPRLPARSGHPGL